MSLDETIKEIRPLDRSSESSAQQRLDSLTKPQGSLGKLEELARRIAVIQGKVPPRLGRKLLFIFAADHGITAEGVSAYPKDVTAQMTYNFLSGGAAINVLARHYGVDTEVVDVGVDHEFVAARGLRDCKLRRGTANFTRGPAMTRAEALRSVELGIQLAQEAAAENLFLLGAGDMGIGNTSSAADKLAGGAYIQGSPIAISGSTFRDNDANGYAGLALFGYGGELEGTISNSTFVGNLARGGLGGAMAIQAASSLTLQNLTIAHNSAPCAGCFAAGIANDSGASLTLRNALFEDNVGGNAYNPWAVLHPAANGTANLQWPLQRPAAGQTEDAAAAGIGLRGGYAARGRSRVADDDGAVAAGVLQRGQGRRPHPAS